MPFFAARSEALQAEFAREEERRFRIATKRDRMLGRWAGEMLGLVGDALDAYAEKIVRAALLMPNGGLIAIAEDFRQSRSPLQNIDLPSKADEYLEVAEKIVKAA